LVIKPEEEIVRTKLYEDRDNTQLSSVLFFVSKEGDLLENNNHVRRITIQSKAMLENLQPTEKKKHIIKVLG
jgi:hypothetical protein